MDASINKYVAYLRTSTKKQMLGLDVQKDIINKFINQRPGSTIIQSFTEQESGFKNDREQLALAMDLTKKEDARLLISTMDRLTRKASFYLQLQEQGVKFTICDMPEADETVIGIMAVLAQRELKMIRERTRNGLQQIKKKIKEHGKYRVKNSKKFITKLGSPNDLKKLAILGAKVKIKSAKKFANNVKPIIENIQEVGKVDTLNGIAAALNARGIATNSKGSSKWYASTVRNVMAYV